jgi:nicotinamide mononucleotide (NMN) deamidase PncC
LLTGSAEIVAPVSGTNVRFHRGVVVFPSTLHATLLDINAKALD